MRAPNFVGQIAALSLLGVLMGCGDPFSGEYSCSTCPTPPPVVYTVQGRVTDARTSAPVAGATVTLQAKRATTSTTGDFVIQELPAGSAALTITHPQYVDLARSIEIRPPFQLEEFKLEPK